MDDVDTRSRQATTYNPPELIAYRDLTENGSIPGGFIIWLVWDKLHANGWFPCVCGASSLVWHQETQTLYFIGPFEKAGKPERPIMFGANWIAHFDLAKPDPSTDERDSDWDKDTSRWKYS
ncbi:hypothetical protein N7463_003405 [Penicillium fimorum]|uniref:Uncharacterized protein n=1 Tax=Penicillium fimorum TaxID=1882269 RepID=A0A9W9Y178_9EURO|nr:hypothetical protein N7463_003405 [Penicillium fimorum]